MSSFKIDVLEEQLVAEELVSDIYSIKLISESEEGVKLTEDVIPPEVFREFSKLKSLPVNNFKTLLGEVKNDLLYLIKESQITNDASRELKEYLGNSKVLADTYTKAYNTKENGRNSDLICLALSKHLEMLKMLSRKYVYLSKQGLQISISTPVVLECVEMNRLFTDMKKQAEQIVKGSKLTESGDFLEESKRFSDSTMAHVYKAAAVVMLHAAGKFGLVKSTTEIAGNVVKYFSSDFDPKSLVNMGGNIDSLLYYGTIFLVAVRIIVALYRFGYVVKLFLYNLGDDTEVGIQQAEKSDALIRKAYNESNEKAKTKGRLVTNRILSFFKQREVEASKRKATTAGIASRGEQASSSNRQINSNIPSLI